MTKAYEVIAPQVAVTVVGSLRYLEKGQIVPEEVDREHVKALVGLGFLKAVDVADPETAAAVTEQTSEVVLPEGLPTADKAWTVAAYQKYAADHDVDVSKAKTREEYLLALTAQ